MTRAEGDGRMKWGELLLSEEVFLLLIYMNCIPLIRSDCLSPWWSVYVIAPIIREEEEGWREEEEEEELGAGLRAPCSANPGQF